MLISVTAVELHDSWRFGRGQLLKRVPRRPFRVGHALRGELSQSSVTRPVAELGRQLSHCSSELLFRVRHRPRARPPGVELAIVVSRDPGKCAHVQMGVADAAHGPGGVLAYFSVLDSGRQDPLFQALGVYWMGATARREQAVSVLFVAEAKAARLVVLRR